MTALKPNAPIIRETWATVQNRPLIIEIHPLHLEIRRKRDRQPYSISLDAVYRYAAKLAADKQRAEKIAAKKAKATP